MCVQLHTLGIVGPADKLTGSLFLLKGNGVWWFTTLKTLLRNEHLRLFRWIVPHSVSSWTDLTAGGESCFSFTGKSQNSWNSSNSSGRREANSPAHFTPPELKAWLTCDLWPLTCDPHRCSGCGRVCRSPSRSCTRSSRGGCNTFGCSPQGILGLHTH